MMIIEDVKEEVKSATDSYIDAYYDMTDEEREGLIDSIKEGIQKLPTGSIERRMERIAMRQMKNYFSDFYIHDMHMLEKSEGGPFIWIVRRSGSHFLHLEDDYFTLREDEWFVAQHYKSLLATISKCRSVYYYNGKQLRKLSEDDALKIIEKHKVIAENKRDVKRTEY